MFLAFNIKTMKLFNLLIIFVIAIPAYAQSVFWNAEMSKSYTKSIDEEWIDAKQLDMNSILFLGLKETKADSGQSIFWYKTNLNGVVLDSSLYKLPNTKYFKIFGFEIVNNLLQIYGVSGRKMKPGVQDSLLLQNFELLSFGKNLLYFQSFTQTYPTTYPYNISSLSYNPKMGGGCYGAFVINFYPGPLHSGKLNSLLTCYYTLKPNGNFEHLFLDTIFHKPGKDSGIALFTPNIVSKEVIQLSENRFLGVKSGGEFGGDQYRVLDSNLKEIPTYGCSYSGDDPFNPTSVAGPPIGLIKNPADPSLFFMAGKNVGGKKQGLFIGNYTIDSIFYNAIDTFIPAVGNRKINVFLPGYGPFVYPALNACLDRLYDNSLTLAYMTNYRKETYGFEPFIGQDSLLLARFDKNLNAIYLRYFNNGEKITLLQVRALSDLSTLLLGYTRNQINDSLNKSKDFFALKVKADGSITSLDQVQFTLPIAHAFPNPFNSSVSVRTEYPAIEFNLFDETGKCLIHQPGSGKENMLQMEGLNPGFYFLQIKYAEQESSWIKLLKE
jgi:hypothetical protein